MADDSAKGVHRISFNAMLGGAAAVATVIAAVVGVLNQFGYIGNHEASRPAEIYAPASATALAPLPKLTSLTGAWRDAGLGGCHLITQTGSKLEVTNYFPGSDAVMSHGEGTVEGTHILLQLRTMHGDYQVSPDGRILNGTMFRSYGPNPSVWKYIGTSCQKSG
jgi:hypothetical protein